MFDPSIFFERLFTILAIFFVGALLYWALGVFARKLSQFMQGAALLADTDRRITTIASLVRTIGTITLFFIGGSMILKTLQIDIAPLLTGAGILGVIASFSAQTLVRDIIAGLFIVLENQYAPGVMVQLDEVEGIVEHISLRSTIICDKNGCKVFVPNGGIRIIRVISDMKKKHRE
ncbi:MAG: mechanosensitive ion channel [Candidatus Uhrbacteria bacterium]|nr:mechanosensitive ion channel [Candidatus Uhrbacteria bacterium]